MALGVGDLIHQAREIVQDTGMEFDYVGDRHTDAKMIRYLNTALTEAYRLRPDLFYPDVYDRTIPEFTDADIGANTAWPVDPTYWGAFVDYVAGYIGLGDDEFATGDRAVALLNRFSQKLVGRNV